MNASLSLPPLYGRWIEELLSGPAPDETRSTCHDCPLISSNASGFVFHPHTKCCTYWPALPNFLIGMILNDSDPAFLATREQMEEFLEKDMVVTPLGATPPSAFLERYKNNENFGTDISLRCPFYREPSGNCSIWKYRNSRCATWFCRFSRGSVSVIFWKYMDQLLATIEKTISMWCILQLGFSTEALRQLFPPPGSQRFLVSEIWGDWLTRKREFFIKCAGLASELNWNEVLQIGGAETQVAGRLLKEANRTLTGMHLPSRVRINQWKKTISVPPDTVRIWTYSRYDPIDLPRNIVESLSCFENGSVQEAMDQLEKKGIRVDVRKLIDFAILAPA